MPLNAGRPRMVYCAVLHCYKHHRHQKQYREKNHISYHKFPKDPKFRKLWADFCGRNKKWSPAPYSLMCSAHFTQACYRTAYNKPYLEKDAIPSENGPWDVCLNSTVKTPEKLFFYVPKDPNIRKKWMKAIRRVDSIGPKTVAFCCEDHFDVETDMDNYIKHKLVGVGRLKLKKVIVPHKFACQNRSVDKSERSVVVKLKTARLQNKLIKKIAPTSHNIEQLFVPDPATLQEESIETDPLGDPSGGTGTENTNSTRKKHKKTQEPDSEDIEQMVQVPTTSSSSEIEPDKSVVNGGVIKRETEPEPEPLEEPDELWNMNDADDHTMVDIKFEEGSEHGSPRHEQEAGTSSGCDYSSAMEPPLKGMHVDDSESNVAQPSGSQSRPLDFLDSFGTYIASMLRTLPPEQSLALQPKIVSLIASHMAESKDKPRGT